MLHNRILSQILSIIHHNTEEHYGFYIRVRQKSTGFYLACDRRQYIAAAAAKQGMRAVLEILEDETEKAIF